MKGREKIQENEKTWGNQEAENFCKPRCKLKENEFLFCPGNEDKMWEPNI